MIAFHSAWQGTSNIVVFDTNTLKWKNIGGEDDYMKLPRWSRNDKYLVSEDLRRKKLVVFDMYGKKLDISFPSELRTQRLGEIYNFDVF